MIHINGFFEKKEYAVNKTTDELKHIDGLFSKDAYGNRTDAIDKSFTIEVEEHPFTKRIDHELFKLEKHKKAMTVTPDFVGFIFHGDELYVSVPKYFNLPDRDHEDMLSDDKEMWKVISTIIQLFDRYKEKLSVTDPLFRKCNSTFSNKFYAAKTLGKIYFERGLYESSNVEYDTPFGSTAWGRTVNEVTADIFDDTPIYSKDVKYRTVDIYNEVTEIEKAVLHYLFQETPYGFVMGMEINESSDKYVFKEMCDENNRDYYLNILREERIKTFDDDFIRMIDIMISLIEDDDDSGKNVMAVMRFDNVFEEMLGDWFGNQLSLYDIKKQGLLVKLYSYFIPAGPDGSRKIEINSDDNTNVDWKWLDEGKVQPFVYTTGDYWVNRVNISVPDTIVESTVDDGTQRTRVSVIIDAKYDYYGKYPERNEVLKQIHYENLIKNVYEVNKAGNVEVHNCFMLPYYSKDMFDNEELFIYKGYLDYKSGTDRRIYVIGVNVPLLVSRIMQEPYYSMKSKDALHDAEYSMDYKHDTGRRKYSLIEYMHNNRRVFKDKVTENHYIHMLE